MSIIAYSQLESTMDLSPQGTPIGTSTVAPALAFVHFTDCREFHNAF